MSLYESRGEVTLPGFVDLHVHLREPSPVNHAEDYASGTRAAALGGYVLVCDMPNTPGHETWFIERVDEKHRLVVDKAYIPIGVYYGSQPNSNNGNQVAPMLNVGSVGGKAYAGPTTSNPYELEPEDFDGTMRAHSRTDRAKPYVIHPGQSNLERFVGVAIQDFGLKIHAAHVESEEQVDIIQAAKRRHGDEMATCEVTAHHLLLTSHDPLSYGWLGRMQPPLADQKTAERLLERLASGDIDAIATDHAPHELDSKLAIERVNPTGDISDHTKTCFGVGGLDFTPRVIFNLVRMGYLGMDRAVDALSTRPARIIGAELSRGTYGVWDMDHVAQISADEIESNAGWSPYVGRLATGKLLELVINGKRIVHLSQLTGERENVPFKRRGQVI